MTIANECKWSLVIVKDTAVSFFVCHFHEYVVCIHVDHEQRVCCFYTEDETTKRERGVQKTKAKVVLLCPLGSFSITITPCFWWFVSGCSTTPTTFWFESKKKHTTRYVLVGAVSKTFEPKCFHVVLHIVKFLSCFWASVFMLCGCCTLTCSSFLYFLFRWTTCCCFLITSWSCWGDCSIQRRQTGHGISHVPCCVYVCCSDSCQLNTSLFHSSCLHVLQIGHVKR